MTILPAFFALATLACTACVAAPATNNGQGASSPVHVASAEDMAAPAASEPAASAPAGMLASPGPVESCVPRQGERRNPFQELSGLVVQDFRVLEPLVAGGTGKVSVTLAETSGVSHSAYPGIHAFSDGATMGREAQLYGISACGRQTFSVSVTPGPNARAGDTIELNFQAGNLACIRGDYPCDGETLTVPVQVAGNAGS